MSEGFVKRPRIFVDFKAKDIIPLPLEWTDRSVEPGSHTSYVLLMGDSGRLYVPGNLTPHSGAAWRVPLELILYDEIEKFRSHSDSPSSLPASGKDPDWEWSRDPELVYLAGLGIERNDPFSSHPKSKVFKAHFRSLDNHHYNLHLDAWKTPSDFEAVLDNESDYDALRKSSDDNGGIGDYFRVVLKGRG